MRLNDETVNLRLSKLLTGSVVVALLQTRRILSSRFSGFTKFKDLFMSVRTPRWDEPHPQQQQSQASNDATREESPRLEKKKL